MNRASRRVSIYQPYRTSVLRGGPLPLVAELVVGALGDIPALLVGGGVAGIAGALAVAVAVAAVIPFWAYLARLLLVLALAGDAAALLPPLARSVERAVGRHRERGGGLGCVERARWDGRD